jgi:hypothetical protein
MIPNSIVAPPARRFFFPSVIDNNPATPPKIEAYKGRPWFFPGGDSIETEGAVVVTVSVLVAGPPLAVSDAGANEHCDSAGRPVQAKLTVWLKPPSGVTVKVKVAVPPALMVALAGDAETLKSMMFWARAEEVDPVKLPSPPYCVVIACVPPESALLVNAATPCAFKGAEPSAVVPSKN